MGLIKDWFTGWLSKPIYTKSGEFLYTEEGCIGPTNFYIKILAINSAINLIKNTLLQAEFKTFQKGKEVRLDDYYLFNVEPNLNYNASRFWSKVVHNLVLNNEALVIQREGDGMLYVADSFDHNQYAFKKNVYYDVVIDDKALYKTWGEQEVFYFKLHHEKIRNILDGLYTEYGNLLEHSKKNYKRSNAQRGILNVPMEYPQTPEAQAKLSNLLDKNFKQFFEAENGSVLPMSNGMTYTDLTNQTYKNGSDSRDIRALVDDIFDFVAIAFQIPPQLLKGSIADSDKSWDNFMTFCINPLADEIEDEINRKFYGRDGYQARTYVKVDTSRIKAHRLQDIANAVDVLTRNGVNTLDDNLILIGREPIGGELGSKRMYTKNLDDLENAGKGVSE